MMKRNTFFAGIVCLAICFWGAPCLAQSTGMMGPELRQWIENPAQGLAALREGRIPDFPKAPEGKSAATPPPAAPMLSDKSVEITFVDPGIEAAVREMLNRPSGPIYDTDVATIMQLDAPGHGIQSLTDLEHMPDLSIVHLQGNRLASLADLPALTHLSQLYLDNNQITSFAGMPVLPSLSRIHARHNRIDTLAGLPSLPKLWEFFIENNEIVSLTGMPELPNLARLNLAHNQLTGVAGLPNNPQMDFLGLSDNSLQSLSGMPKYRSVNLLDISSNQLTTADGLYNKTHIDSLQAGHNRLESLGVIGQLYGMYALSVEANRLTSLAGVAVSDELRELDVSQNQLASLTGVERYPQLVRLNASGNCLKSLGALAGLGNLRSLYLAGCGLTSLADFPRMPGLQFLDLSCNQLNTLADMGDTPALGNLEAKCNQLQSLDVGSRPVLSYLGVSSNGLTSLATLNGADCPYMNMIDASFNQLTSLQGVENAPNLSAIAARGNRIGSLAALSQSPLLNWLDVSSNQLASFDDLPPNPPIGWLNAAHNHIGSLQGLATAANLYLSRLDVSHNMLTAVTEIAAANNLYSLDISDNQITDISPLVGRGWNEMRIANNPTGDVQSVLFNGFGAAPSIVSVGPGQLPSLAPIAKHSVSPGIILANGPEYADLSLLGEAFPYELRVSGAGISSLEGLAKSLKMYQDRIAFLALPNNALTDLSPLADAPMTWLDVSGNNVADVSPVTSGYRLEEWRPEAIQYLNLSSNPLESLQPVRGRNVTLDHFPPIGTNIFYEYQLEQFGMTPEQAHSCLFFNPVVDVTNTPVAAAPEVAELRTEGVRVTTDGTCSYCQGACAPPAGVPNVAGMTQEAASAALSAAGLAAGNVTQQCSDTVAAGAVVSSDPASGAMVDAGSSVALVVASGLCTVPVAVPNLVGQTASDAVAAIQAAGLDVGVLTEQYSDSVALGTVISQDPAAGTSVMPNTAVSLVLSLGPIPPEGENEHEGEGEFQMLLAGKAQALLQGFAAADTNGDGRLSLAEAQVAQPGLTADEFALLDRNGDGTLSKRELDACLDGGHGGPGCHGGGSGWGGGLGELLVMLITLLGLGVIGSHLRP